MLGWGEEAAARQADRQVAEKRATGSWAGGQLGTLLPYQACLHAGAIVLGIQLRQDQRHSPKPGAKVQLLFSLGRRELAV